MSVCLAAYISPAPTGWIFVKYDIEGFYESLKRPNLIKTGQKLWALYMGTYVHFIVAGDVKLP
jgi:hypothetical protein